ncbi:MAG: hydantoinase/oxoprolinase family protein [Paracoccaceae bacterium]|nr:hydantoinase/oxoprolinase family protein [Paracoccaceae bacterium]
MTENYRIGVDIGGTFTDIVLLNEATGISENEKILTTQDDPSLAVLQGVSDILKKHNVAPSKTSVIHGTTLVANALIERKGVATALVTSKGFKDVLEIGREWRYNLFDLEIQMPKPLIPRHRRFEIAERVGPNGNVIMELDEDEVVALIQKLVGSEVRAVAVLYLHAFKNDKHEQRTKELFNLYAPEITVCLSSEVSPEIGEYERASTVAANAYVQPIFQTYVQDLATGLHGLGIEKDLFLMLSDGGTVHQKAAVEFPIRLVQSGPAGGAQAATLYGRISNEKEILCFDMGGTTAKACIIEGGRPSRTTSFEVARVFRFAKGSGLPLQVPVVDMIEIGAGGGSIAHLDNFGLIQIGPESASSQPGPACYGLGGTQPTVTDADLVLGYLDPKNFLGGDMQLSQDAAESAIKQKISDPMGISVIEAAWAIHETVTENMAQAAIIHALEKGRKVENFSIVPIGGAGPVHACSLATKMGISRLVCPPSAGVASAIGMLASPTAFEFVQADMQKLDNLNFKTAQGIFETLEARGNDLLKMCGLVAHDMTFTCSALMRYSGQGYEVEVPLEFETIINENCIEILNSFEAVYKELFGRTEKMPLEIISWRVVASGPTPKFVLKAPFATTNKGCMLKRQRRVYFGESTGFTDASIFDRTKLEVGFSTFGPAIVEERESTLVIPPEFNLTIEASGNMLLSRRI